MGCLQFGLGSDGPRSLLQGEGQNQKYPLVASNDVALEARKLLWFFPKEGMALKYKAGQTLSVA